MNYIITTAVVAATLIIIAKILFLGKRLGERRWRRTGWAILDNREYVVFDDREE